MGCTDLERGRRAMQEFLWFMVGALLLLAVASGFAEHRRRNRIDMDRVGFLPWPLIQFLSLIGALMAASLALHLG
jgi:hypothetical protein